jgi:hypothetical protein
MRKRSFFVFAGVAGITFAVAFWRALSSPVPESLKVSYIGYTNGTEVFRLTNPSSHTLRLPPYAWLITQEGQQFGSFTLPSSLTNGLSPRMSYTLIMPTPLCGCAWRAQFDVEPPVWRRQWYLAKAKLRRLGFPTGDSGYIQLSGSSEIIGP